MLVLQRGPDGKISIWLWVGPCKGYGCAELLSQQLSLALDTLKKQINRFVDFLMIKDTCGRLGIAQGIHLCSLMQEQRGELGRAPASQVQPRNAKA